MNIHPFAPALTDKSMNQHNFRAAATGPASVMVATLLATVLPGLASAQSVQQALVETVAATPFRYDVDGRTLTWGLGDNIVMRGFVSGDRGFGYNDTVSRIELRTGVDTGLADTNPCAVFVERLDDSGERLAADYPGDGSGTGACDIAFVLQSRIVNRGASDLFSNQSPAVAGLERADFIFNRGSLAPFDDARLDDAGHAIAEREGDSPVQIAAILSLDVFGQPDAYGPLLTIGAAGCADGERCYSTTDLTVDYASFSNASGLPTGYPGVNGLTQETVSMAFVSTRELGLRAGQKYHGFSLFADDVDASIHTLADPASFPTDTAGGLSLHGGLSGYFLSHDMPVATGHVFLDSDGNGRFGAGDANVQDIDVSLHRDSDGDGRFDPAVDEALIDSIESDTGGIVRFPGMPDGDYFLVLDTNDVDMPGGLSAAGGTSVLPFQVVDGRVIGEFDFPLVGDGSGAGEGDGSVGDGSETGDGSDGSESGDRGDGSDEGGVDGDDGGDVDGDTAGQSASGTDDGAADAGDGAGDSGADDGGADSGGEVDAGATTGSLVQDGRVTAAFADSFEINQGDALVATVLDNDIDAAGLGLTIVAVGDSGNGTTVIDGQAIVYTPDVGFIGTDTFTYTLQDGAGTQASGAVTVQVLRYSDINGNLINDFDECAAAGIDCGNLQLETGVHGSGIGGLSPALLFLLAPLLGSRRIRRRGTARSVAAREVRS